MLNSKLSKTSCLTCLLLTFALFIAPLVGIGAQTIKRDTERQASPDLKTLSQYGVDLTEMARRGSLQPVDGYDAQIKSTLRILARETRNNPVLLSEDEAARNSIVAGVAQRIADGNAPANLMNKRVFNLSLESLSAGAVDGEEFNRRFEAVLSEAKSSKGGIILFIDGLDDLVAENSSVNSSAANILEAALADGELRLVGAAAPESFETNVAQREGFKGKLQEIFIDAVSEDTAKADGEKDKASEETQNSVAFVGDKIAPELNELIQSSNSNTESVNVILQGDALNSSRLRAFIRQNDIHITGQYSNLNAQAIKIPAPLIRQLADFDQVSYLSLDRATVSLGHIDETTGADDIRDIEKTDSNGKKQSIEVNGAGVGIAILDSGIYANHKSFLDRAGKTSRVVFSKDFTGEGRTDDPYGHGTYVASLAAGNNRIVGSSYTGIAPEASIINLRVLNSAGTGKTSALLDALNWVLSNHAAYNIRVVNMSLGAAAVNSYKNDPVCRAVRSLTNAGIVVVASAGNEGKDSAGKKVYGQLHSPGNEPSAITVGAANTFGTNTRVDDTVATYSSRGPTRSYWTDAAGVRHYDNLIKPDLVAPGNKLIGAESDNCTLVKQNPSLDDNVSKFANSDMMTLSGTSVATPIVAGSAALILQTKPNLTPNMIKALLLYTAQPLVGYNTFEQGAGELNIEGAVMRAQMIRPDFSASTPLGAPLFTQAPMKGATIGYTTISGYTFPWSQGIILNHTYATGDELNLYQKIYAQGVLLGDCEVISNGVLLSDATMVTRGVLLGDTIMTSSGGALTQGTPFVGTGVLLGDGVLLSDGVLLGDGVLLSDGVLLGDNISLTSVPLLSGDNTASMTIKKE